MRTIFITAFILVLSLQLAISQTGSPGIQGRFWIDATTLGTRTSAQQFFRTHGAALGLSSVHDSTKQIKSRTDSLGFTHYRFQQYHKGVKVDGADCILHERNGLVEKANGRLVTGLNANMRVLISSQQAIDSAIAHMAAHKYMWEDSLEEAEIKIETGDTSATYYPSPELVFIKPYHEQSWTPDSFRLVYCVQVHAFMPLNSVAWYIDAQTGEVFRKRPLMPFCGHTQQEHEAASQKKAQAFGMKRFGTKKSTKTQNCTQGTGITTFNGTQTIYTDWHSGTYRLRDDCDPGWIWTRFYGDPINNANVTEFTDANNVWTSANDEIGVSAHWGIKRSQDYFKNVHNRNGWNNSGQDIKVYCRRNFGTPQNPTSDASFSWATQGYFLNAKIYFGDRFNNLASDDMTPLDIAGHEFAHGVTSSESGLVYERESGALNEAFSDIFGECIEQWVTGTHVNWWHGGERTNSGGNQISGRNMQDPPSGLSQQQPDTYQGINWVNTNCNSPDQGNDYCGVHTNSGVLNKAFYLMVDGESGVNDNGDPYEVQGIGFVKSRKIVYRAQMNYLSSQDEYVDAREAFIQSAEDLYGVCSNEAIQVAKAFYAVGVGSGTSKYDRFFCGAVIPAPGNTLVEGVRSITSGGNNCLTIVTPNGSGFLYRAGLEVVFKDNFTAPVGSNLQVITNDCALTKD